MSKRLLALAWACAAVAVTSAAAAQFSSPKPEVFQRPEDQRRARLLGTPCTESDVGRGCYRVESRLVRQYPCTSYDGRVTSSRPVDRCYRMDVQRRYRGVWVDEFEGQKFIPTGQKAPEWPTGDPRAPGFREASDKAIAATIWLDVSRVKLKHQWQRRGRRVAIEFIGRRTLYPGNYGHMGLSGHEIVVDRLISSRECPRDAACE